MSLLTIPAALHQTNWPNLDELATAIAEIEQLPPITSEADSDQAMAAMANVSLGRSVALMLGDCAQPFRSPADQVRYMETLARFARAMGINLKDALGQDVELFLRMAQFFKPRSNPFELVSGRDVLTYRGAGINDRDPNQRTPDPRRLIEAYHQAAHCWSILKLINQRGVPIMSSREMLELVWEQALVRDRRNTSTGMIWLGARTNDPEGAHVQLAAGLLGPIAVKIGPGTTTDKLMRLIELLNPDDVPGRLTLIFRLGLAHVRDDLPGLLQTIDAAGRTVGLICDPMHGNPLPGKTRDFDTMLAEARTFRQITGPRFGGLHLEATPENVSECLGGPHGTTERDLHLKSDCDPRLNGQETRKFIELLAA